MATPFSNDDDQHVDLVQCAQSLFTSERLGPAMVQLLATAGHFSFRPWVTGELLDFCGAPRLPSRTQLARLAHYVRSKKHFRHHWTVADVVGSSGGTQVYMVDLLHLLDPSLWLNDVTIIAIALLIERLTQRVCGSHFILPTYWPYTYCINPLKRLDAQAASTSPPCTTLFAPIHVIDHWFLLVVHVERGTCTLLDPFHQPWEHYVQLDPRLETNWWHLHQTLTEKFPHVSWKRCVPCLDHQFPLQMDGTSCGLYVLYAMECIVMATEDTAFSQLSSWDSLSGVLRLRYACALLDGYITPADQLYSHTSSPKSPQ
jgi:hypothetical protein